MRSKTIILALNLGALAAVSHAQILTPVKPTVAAPAGTPAVAAPAAAPTGASAQPSASSAAPAGSLAPGVISLSDVAKQSTAATAPTTAQPVPVPAITVTEGTGQPIELAREKFRTSSNITGTPSPTPLRLVRLTRVGGEDTAVIWIKGQNRKVTNGSRVLQYAVGEIKEDGVCLYPVQTKAKAKGKAKDKCKPFLTFQGM